METEKKWSMTKLLLLPVIVFLVMQYQIDELKAEQSAIYYHSALEGLQRDIYDLEKQMYIEFQRIEKGEETLIVTPAPDSTIDIRG
jgi:hypothetical protein